MPLVCLLIRFLFFLGSSVSDGILFFCCGFVFSRSVCVFWVDVLNFFSFLVGLLMFFRLLFWVSALVCVEFSFLGCCIFWLLHSVISSCVLHFVVSGLCVFWRELES